MNIKYIFHKVLIEIQVMFLSKRASKVIRKRKKSLLIRKIYNENFKKLKWGVSYSVFDGEELLEKSLMSIRSEVDYINVVYQTKSWYGNPASENLLPTLQKLKDKGLIDELIEYKPQYSLRPTKQESNKRNIGLKYAVKNKCNYFMPMDCDEFYETKDLIYAKKYIFNNNITNSYVQQYKYMYKPTQLNINYAGFVGLFFKINKTSRIGKDKKVPIIIDGTRVVVTNMLNKKYFVLSAVKMHHMSLVRKNLNIKVENSSFSNGSRKVILPSFGGQNSSYIANVPDIFNIGEF